MRQTWFLIVLMCCSLISLVSCSQDNNSPVIKGPYLGQKPPGMTPEVFAPGIVSTKNHEHSRLEFSKDRLKLFWAVIPVDTNYKTHSGRPFKVADQNIWHTIHGEHGWSVPKILPFECFESRSPTFSADRRVFYFRALNPNLSKDKNPRGGFIWETIKNDTGWEDHWNANNV